MKLVILYRPKSEQATAIDNFVRDYQARYSRQKLELVNLDDREGIALASLYDVMSFPAILVLADDGRMQYLWSDPGLPLIDTVAAYMH